ncbi:hypothetical protein [Bacillus marinisedimentorum]|uniref:hypothetical protein n=1 Tax=Bacillus marinisedimentorum TaxID=1821260 RepID=UPI0008728E13|nr:hypothetical protein [Bacillus marinisedimentorum]
MDDKLNDLEQVMDRAVYQKQRFTPEAREAAMGKIKSSRPKKRKHMFRQAQYFLSIALFTLFFGFILGYITGGERGLLQNASSPSEDRLPVASLPLINKTVHIARQDHDILHVTAGKSEHNIELSFTFPASMSDRQMKDKIEWFLQEGTSLSRDVKELQETGSTDIDVWNDYTLTIFVNGGAQRSLKESGLFAEETGYQFKGYKNAGESQITWTGN